MSRLPEPALVRSVLVAITGLVAFFLGREIDTAWIESVLIIYGLFTPVLAGLLIRPAVTPIADRTASDE
ncbi:hypothetical protein ABZV58_03275 [Nocardia sp. NPDC004654]|uniref:hypothetical protein n=1 Tax=Nocardia sp. NPDC004654 TaxID=3154776 RepID=UPI0033AC1ABF